MPGRPTVLVVEDNDMMRKLLFAELSQDGRFQVEQASTGEEGLEKAVASDCSVIVLDMMLPDTDGLQFIERLRIKRPDCPSIIAITGAPTSALPDGVIEGPYRGFVSAIFRKPFDHAKLRETVAFCATA
ncbi:MAG TPA: response regulator [Thermoanaerobaculia bacterium]|nr:response regulator [Thermoanaerobaculia bacterium]